MIVYPSSTRVFYNKDVGQYGVEHIVEGIRLHCKDGITRQLHKWQQHPLPARNKAYTPYRKVAERWAKRINGGTIEVRADMEEEYRC